MSQAEQAVERRRLPAWCPALLAVCRAQPVLALIVITATMVSGGLPAVFIVLSGVAAGLLGRIGSADVATPLAMAVAALAVLLALSQLTGIARQGVAEALGRKMDMVLRRRLIEAVAKPVGVAHLEDRSVLSRVATAQGLANRLSGPAGGLLGLLGRAQVMLIGLCCALLLFWVDPALAVALAAANLIVGAGLRREYRSLLRATHLDPGVLRRAHYLRDVVLAPGAEKELRAFGIGGLFIDLHHEEWLQVARLAWRDRRTSWVKILAGAVVLGAGQAVAFAVLAAGWRAGTVGPVGLVIGIQASLGLLQFVAVTEWDRLANIGWEAVDALREVEGVARSEHSPNWLAPGSSPSDTIEFRDVHFTYPDGTYVLRGVSMQIKVGQSFAIVGRNGAGKSTLLKLLMRSYEPSSGEILVDGVPLSRLDPVAWRARLSTIVQDFVRLPLTVAENVVGPDREADTELLEDIARRTGLDEVLDELPAGWDTVLSRQLPGGTDLSGGQWQKVALARGLYAIQAGAAVLILDEPTANLDLESECEIYETILDLTAKHTLILVSHRFATVRKVEQIVVLDAGRIVDSGNHDELMSRPGVYQQLFDAQAAIVR